MKRFLIGVSCLLAWVFMTGESWSSSFQELKTDGQVYRKICTAEAGKPETEACIFVKRGPVDPPPAGTVQKVDEEDYVRASSCHFTVAYAVTIYAFERAFSGRPACVEPQMMKLSEFRKNNALARLQAGGSSISQAERKPLLETVDAADAGQAGGAKVSNAK